MSEQDFVNVNNDEKIKAEALQAMTGNSIIDPSGWIEVDRKKFSYDGRLYPKSYRFMVKPSNAGLLKYFSTLDESNPLTVQDALMYVIEHHVRVMDGKKVLKSLDTIYGHDRLYFTLLVHQYSGNVTDLIVNVTTPSNEKQESKVTCNSLLFNELTEKGWSYLNPTSGKFEIKTKSYGVIAYSPMTIQQETTLTQYVYDETQKERKSIEPFFTTAAPFFITRENQSVPGEIYREYIKQTQDENFISLLIEIQKHISPELLLEFNIIDEKTKEPFRSPVTSLRGIKDIFTIHNTSSELQ